MFGQAMRPRFIIMCGGDRGSAGCGSAHKWIGSIGLAAGLALTADATAATRDAPRAKPDSIDISYVEPQSPNNRAVYQLLKERQALEKLRDLLRPLRLPHRLLLQTRDCEGISNAWSDEESVTVCYEYINDVWKNAPDKTTPGGVAPIDALIGPFLDVFLHETGHAVFAILKIPLFGREEDAADQFSTYILLRFDKEEARRLILGSAYQYKGDLSSPTVTTTQQKFADEHGLPAQRFYNLLCMAYGADPKLFADVVKKEFLPEDRAVGCEREYTQVAHAFDSLIGPHIDKKRAQALHKRWLPPVDSPPPRRPGSSQLPFDARARMASAEGRAGQPAPRSQRKPTIPMRGERRRDPRTTTAIGHER
jgi:Putative metallopeptidase